MLQIALSEDGKSFVEEEVINCEVELNCETTDAVFANEENEEQLAFQF